MVDCNYDKRVYGLIRNIRGYEAHVNYEEEYNKGVTDGKYRTGAQLVLNRCMKDYEKYTGNQYESVDILSNLIGLLTNDAKVVCWDNGYMPRVVCEDGEDFILTMDFITDRVNLTLVEGLVTKCVIG